ncbi:MAG TPA: recombinase family protein, partial [Solirubrobacterales bacterium]|nr:recombinase family protein [Solirubrobacterales bacterium]
VYLGKLVWHRRDFSTQREAGGAARLRAEEDWVVSEIEHPPLVSQELYERVQERFRARSKGGRPRNGTRQHLLSGFVKCASGHPARAMYAKVDKGTPYCVCAYARDYGDVAAEQIEGHGKWLRLREDVIVPLVEKFFAERIFGPMRLDKLERQLRTHNRKLKRETVTSRTRISKEIAELDRKISKQIEALEADVEPELVGRRIAALRTEKEKLEAALADLGGDVEEASLEEIAHLLSRMPDLSKELRKAPLELKRQVFQAFDLKVSTTGLRSASRSRRRCPKGWPRPSPTQRTSRRRSIA